MTPLVSYTVPCHKRVDDLWRTWLPLLDAARAQPPVEIVIVDYGNEIPLLARDFIHPNILYKRPRVEAEYFHMAHARNVGIRAATGEIIVAFLADQIVAPDFFKILREQLQPGTFLKWFETFVFWREDILSAGGFDERFEFYGPEGKELTDRLERRGLKALQMSDRIVSQIPTPNHEKVKHYREKLSKREMHLRGMKIWQENKAAGLTVANQGIDWGACA